MNVSREAFGSNHFFDLKDLWFSSLFDEVEFPWELLKAGTKEAWIEKTMKANVSKLAREGSLVTKTVRLKAGKGEATIEAGPDRHGPERFLRGELSR